MSLAVRDVTFSAEGANFFLPGFTNVDDSLFLPHDFHGAVNKLDTGPPSGSLTVETGRTKVTCQERRELAGSKSKLGSKLRLKPSFTGLGSDTELQEGGPENVAVNLP